MRLSDFDFDLPDALIAQTPARPPESARLLHAPPDGGFGDRTVADLPALLRPDDVLVVNDTRVIPARLRGRRGDVRIEVTLHAEDGPDLWRAFAKPAKRLRPGDVVAFDGALTATVEARDGPEAVLRFDRGGDALAAALDRCGAPPLPPYIKRPDGATAQDQADYQTMFAAQSGSVAAATAGLHFTPALLARCEAAGAAVARITLHVGAGTFLPVTAEDPRDHVMHAERWRVDAAAAGVIAKARAVGGRVIAVGSTALRTLEQSMGREGAGETRLFITPGQPIRMVDAMLTNFHLPKSTLFMLVAAFIGLDRAQAAYAHAIAKGYRFFSYGDATFLERP
ncbi:MAG: tRNA preQ1(34) S-adenosylmethionine ribosyltransferase-isomerase QueA [Pseudomonadota bacterium]